MHSENYDYIIVGAGSAGCALAARLTENAHNTVLLVEAGGEAKNLWIPIPLGVGRLYNDRRLHWPFMTEPEPHLHGQSMYCPVGRVIGGSSSINGLLFVRGAPQEYDRWCDAGCPGWSYPDVLPYFKRLEHRAGGDSRYRGRGGPITVSDVPHRDALTEAFYQSCLELGVPSSRDYNSGDYEGVAYLQLSTRAGRRCSSASGYLRNARSRKNLVVLIGTVVTRILLEGNVARGVTLSNADGTERRVSASREVILCAGAINSPRLLELSGIGDNVALQHVGIVPQHHLPGVGENLQDHLNTRITYRCTQPITINDALNGFWRGARLGLQYLFTRRGLMATPSVTVHALVRSKPSSERVDLKLQITHLSGESRYSMIKGRGVDAFSGFMLGSTPLHPESRGSVHVRSANPLEHPEIHANYLAQASDVETALCGLKMLRRLAQQSKLQAMIEQEVRPGSKIDTDEDLINYIRSTAQTSWHQIGTCKMGSDSMAVVDPELRVRGLHRLRVADVSVLPHLVSANTNAPAIMIGERCAGLINAA
jgi:choline dehydrogenase